MSRVEALLDAGALVPVKSKVDKESAVDPISARIYRHEGLGDRPVIRLSADGLAQGDDLAMEFLGFEAPEVEGPLGLKRRQALGFPGWALINDPDHARYALELVKEFRKEARRAKSKPGHAYDGFVEIAKRLDRSVAHFLPSYWEEAGREFMQVGNSTYASRAFSKAREAEKVHSLEVDENLRQEAFLEFALAGCLTNKALTEYCKDLQASHTADEAWRFYRELVVRRTLGGMPPWTSLAKELSQLIKAAGLDVEAELRAFLTEIIESPAMNRTPMGFWKSVSATVKALAEEDDQVAGTLLNLMPECSYWNNENVWIWLGYLEEWDLLANAWQDNVPAAAGPQGGAVKWLERYLRIDDTPPQRAFDLLQSMAERLRKDGEPINLKTRWNTNVDLLDIALELKVPVVEPDDDSNFNLNEWANVDDDAVDRPRDPVHVNAHKGWRKHLEQAVAFAAGNPTFEAAAHGKNALAKARKSWLKNLVAELDSGGIPAAANALDSLEGSTSRTTFQEFPEAYTALKKANILPAIQRTIQAGLIDEYGWPALEKVVDQLNPDGEQELQFFGAAPHIVVSDGVQVIVVGPEGVVYEHEIKLKKGQSLERAAYADGQLQIVLETSSWENVMYWSENPKKTTKKHYYGRDDLDTVGIDLESGGTFVGSGTVHAGDEDLCHASDFFHDGEHFWRYTWHNDEHAVRQVSPDGEVGRKSLPKFLEDFLKGDTKIDLSSSRLLRLGDYTKNSPLGSANGLVGWRIRFTARTDESSRHQREIETKVECEGIDGRKWKGDLGSRRVLGLLDQPGTDARLPFTDTSSYGDDEIALWDPEGKFEVGKLDSSRAANAGQAVTLPPVYWHAFEARDEKASKKLRKLSDKQTETLIAAARQDAEASAELDEDDEEEFVLTDTTAALKKWLTGLKSDRMARGLARLLVHAADLVERLETLIEDRDPSVEEVAADPGIEAIVHDALRSISGGYVGYADRPLFPHLAEVAKFFAGEREGGSVHASYDWTGLLDGIEANLLSAYWAADELDEDLLKFLEAWSELGIVDLPGRFRKFSAEPGTSKIKFKKKRRHSDDDPPWLMHEEKGHLYLIWKEYEWRDEANVLEYAPKGKFKVPAGFKLDADEDTFEGTASWSGERLREYVAAFRERERPWPQLEVLQEVGDQLGVSSAEVGLFWFGLPNIGNYEKNYLPKPIREHLKLKVKDAEAARTGIRGLKPELQSALLAALLDGPAADLWEDDGRAAFARLQAAWKGSVPKRLDVSPELMKVLEERAGYENRNEKVNALADPKKHPRLKAEGTWKIAKSGDHYDRLRVQASSSETFDTDMMRLASVALPLLYSSLPTGAEAIQQAMATYEQALKCLKKPGLLFELGRRYFWGDDKDGKASDLLAKAVGKTQKKKGISSADNGTVIGLASDEEISLAFRPAKVKTAADIEKLQNIMAALWDREESDFEIDIVSGMEMLQSKGFEAIRDRVKNTDLQAGQYDSNPLHSAPKLVATVAKKHKVSEEAAALYLQLLALADPTTANLKKWNDWSAAQITKAGKELLGKKLVLQAKRSRAGRNLFIPGGWEAFKLPHLPIESWKLPLFQVERSESLSRPNMPLNRILPLQPIPDLFQAAWKRTLDGDAPGYEEVK